MIQRLFTNIVSHAPPPIRSPRPSKNLDHATCALVATVLVHICISTSASDGFGCGSPTNKHKLLSFVLLKKN